MNLDPSATPVTGDSPPTCIGAPPPPRAYDPGFFKPVTYLSALVLLGSILLVGWFAVDIPKLARIEDPERALEHMVGRLMDVEAGFAQLPEWERDLYEISMGSSADEREEAVEWYRELAGVSIDPRVSFNLAVLLAESGQLQEFESRVEEWRDGESPFPIYAHLLDVAYSQPTLARDEEQEAQAQLAELVPAGWFYDRVAMHLAEAAGNRPLWETVRASSERRADMVVQRYRTVAAVETGLMAAGGITLIWWIRRRNKQASRVGRGELPPLWAGGLGAAVLLRGGAIGAVLTLGFMFAALDFSSLRLLVVPLSNVPLLCLAYVHLLKPQGLAFIDGFGLTIDRGKAGRLAAAVLAVVAAGLLGEWVMGRIAAPLNLSSHWTEWFDSDLVWAPVPVVAVSLAEYVLFAPIFEELAFRGLLFGVLRRRFQWGPAALMSAAVFAFAHGYGLMGFMSVFWSGVLWAWIYEKTGSLLPGMIAHATNNLLVCLSVLALLRA